MRPPPQSAQAAARPLPAPFAAPRTGDRTISAAAFNVVMFAALLHASWNAIVKGSGDKLLTTAMITVAAALLSAAILPALPSPARASWPFLAASAVLQSGYFVMVATTYRAADMAQAYPLMRGTAPLVVAAASVLFLGEMLPAAAWWGVGVICAGILALAAAAPGRDRRGTGLALATALVIACYTMVDGTGVRLSGTPAAYTLWLSLLTGIPFAAWLAIRRPPAFSGYLRRNWSVALIGSLGTLLSYGLALWAMTRAPIPVVSALRESSILFGTAISALVLKESVGPRRIGAALLILAGAATIRLS